MEINRVPLLHRLHLTNQNGPHRWIRVPSEWVKSEMKSIVSFFSRQLPKAVVHREEDVLLSTNEISCAITKHIPKRTPPVLGTTGAVFMDITLECYVLPTMQKEVVVCLSNKSATKIDHTSLKQLLSEIVHASGCTVIEPRLYISDFI
jgi:hypothetical protein